MFCEKSAKYSKVFQTLFGLQNRGKEKVKKFVASKNPPSYSDHQNHLINLSEKKDIEKQVDILAGKINFKIEEEEENR